MISVPVDKEFRGSLNDSGCLPRMQSCEDLTREGGCTSKGAHPHGWRVNTGFWWETSVPHHTGFFIGLLECPDDKAADIPPGPVMEEKIRQKLQST